MSNGHPELPLPGEPVRLLAAVWDEDLLRVGGEYDLGAGPREILLRDDGLSGDDLAGDGVFTGDIQPAPRGSIVEYMAYATDAAGHRIVTPPHRYPVADFDIASDLPVYHLFIREAEWESLNRDIWTERYFPAVLVHDGEAFTDVGLRFRGGPPRLFLYVGGPAPPYPGYPGCEEFASCPKSSKCP